MFNNNRRSGSIKNDFKSSHWYKPSANVIKALHNEKEYVKSILTLSNAYVKSSMTLNDAWNIHLQELRDGILCDLPPQPTPINETISMHQGHYDATPVTPTKKKGPKKGSKI